MSDQEVTERDYLAEMDKHIDAATEGSGWVAAVVAGKLYARIAVDDPDLLDGWLHILGPDTLRRVIHERSSAARMRERGRARKGEFADAARNYETGEDSNGLKLAGMFALLHVVSAEDVRKRAGEMTGADHEFVARSYQKRGQRALMQAAFHRAVAEKIGTRRTDEVMDLGDYERLYRSIAGNMPEDPDE